MYNPPHKINTWPFPTIKNSKKKPELFSVWFAWLPSRQRPGNIAEQELPVNIHGLGIIFHPHLHDFQTLFPQPILQPLRMAIVKRWPTGMAARAFEVLDQRRGNNW